MTGPIAIVGAGYVGLPLAQVFGGAGNRVVLIEANPEKVELVKRGESYIRDVPSEGLRPLVESGAIEITSNYDVLAEADAILIALQTPLTAQREPDLSIVLGAAADIAPRLQKGQLVVLESTTYPGTTRERLQADPRERQRARGRRGLPPRLLARARRSRPRGLDDPEHAEDRRRPHPCLHGARGRALQACARDGAPGLVPGGGRADEAPREHLPLGQHRARQRARAALRPDADRRLGGHRRGRNEAVRVHELPAGPRARRPLHADRPLLPDLEGARIRLLHRVHRARRQGQREHAVLVPRQDRPRAERAREGPQGLEDPAPRRLLQGRHRRHARVAGAEDDRAAPGGRSGRLVPRPIRARAARAWA